MEGEPIRETECARALRMARSLKRRFTHKPLIQDATYMYRDQYSVSIILSSAFLTVV